MDSALASKIAAAILAIAALAGWTVQVGGHDVTQSDVANALLTGAAVLAPLGSLLAAAWSLWTKRVKPVPAARIMGDPEYRRLTARAAMADRLAEERDEARREALLAGTKPV